MKVDFQPSYSSAVLLELYRQADRYSLSLSYRNDSFSDNIVEFSIPGWFEINIGVLNGNPFHEKFMLMVSNDSLAFPFCVLLQLLMSASVVISVSANTVFPAIEARV